MVRRTQTEGLLHVISSTFPASEGIYKLLFFFIMLALVNGIVSNTLQSPSFLLGS